MLSSPLASVGVSVLVPMMRAIAHGTVMWATRSCMRMSEAPSISELLLPRLTLSLGSVARLSVVLSEPLSVLRELLCCSFILLELRPRSLAGSIE